MYFQEKKYKNNISSVSSEDLAKCEIAQKISLNLLKIAVNVLKKKQCQKQKAPKKGKKFSHISFTQFQQTFALCSSKNVTAILFN